MMIHFMPDTEEAFQREVALAPTAPEIPVDGFVLIDPARDDLIQHHELNGRTLIEIRVIGNRIMAIYI